MAWVLLAILLVAALVLLLRGPVREWQRRRAERAQERKRVARKARQQAKERGNPERALNKGKAAARSGAPTWQQVAARQGGKCWLCGTRTYEDDRRRSGDRERLGATYPVVDLMVPIERGGTYAPDNLRVAHRHCAQVRQSNPARTEYGRPPRTFGG